MPKKTNEKSKKKNTKDNNALDLDNEIIIGIKTLPQPNQKKSSNKKSKKSSNKKASVNNFDNLNIKGSKVKKTNTKKKKSSTSKNKEDVIELNLGIEDENLKRKSSKKRKTAKQQEIAKNKRKIKFRIVKYTTLVAILIGGGICFLLSPFFNVNEIVVIGNEKITKEEIISLSGIQLNENTFKLKYNVLQENIKQNTYINDVIIRRKLPNKIEIEVEERKPTFILAFANAYVYINNQGYMLEISQTKLNVPTITGFLTPEEEIHSGNRLCSEDLQRLDHVLQIMKSAQSNGIADLITSINISDKQNYILELAKEKKTVYIGDSSNLSTKMLYIISILNENKKVEGEIFVNTDLNNKGAIFRKKV